MGGIVCSIPWLAAVPGDEFPANPTKHQLDKIELQMRTALLNPLVAQSADERGVGSQVCELLEREHLSEADLRELYRLAKPPYGTD